MRAVSVEILQRIFADFSLLSYYAVSKKEEVRHQELGFLKHPSLIKNHLGQDILVTRK